MLAAGEGTFAELDIQCCGGGKDTICNSTVRVNSQVKYEAGQINGDLGSLFEHIKLGHFINLITNIYYLHLYCY